MSGLGDFLDVRLLVSALVVLGIVNGVLFHSLSLDLLVSVIRGAL